MRYTARASRLAGQLLERPRVRRVRRADHDDRVAARRDRDERRLPVRRREAEVAAAGRPQLREPVARSRRARRPSRGATASSARAARPGRRSRAARRRRRPISTRWIDVGRDGHRADRLLVTLVADVHDVVALAGAHLHLVVHLGDERAHGVDDEAAGRPRGLDDLGRRAVRRQHERRPGRHLARCRRRRRRRGRRTAARPAGCGRSRGSSTPAARRPAPSTPAP